MCDSRRNQISEQAIVAQLRLKSLLQGSLPARKSDAKELLIVESGISVALDDNHLEPARVGAIFSFKLGRLSKQLPLVSVRFQGVCEICSDHMYNHSPRLHLKCTKCFGKFDLACKLALAWVFRKGSVVKHLQCLTGSAPNALEMTACTWLEPSPRLSFVNPDKTSQIQYHVFSKL